MYCNTVVVHVRTGDAMTTVLTLETPPVETRFSADVVLYLTVES